MEKSTKIALAVLAAAVVGGVLLYRRKAAGLGKSKLIGTTTKNGKTSKLYRGKMPIEDRIGHIQDMVFISVQDPDMRKLALDITSSCPARDGDCEAKAIYDWVKKNVRYTGDIAPIKMGRKGKVDGIDLYQAAKRTVEYHGGDCDDHSVLNATLLALNGITPKLAVTAETKNGPDGHIYAMAALPKMKPKELRALDTTLPGEYYGTEAPYGRRRLFPA